MALLCGAAWPSPSRAQEGTRLVVGTETDYPPFAIIDKEGLPDGFSVDLIKAVAEAVSADLIFRVGTWSDVKRKLARGEVDLLPHVFYSEQRDKSFDFSVIHTRSDAAFFVQKGRFSNMTLRDLSRRKVIVMRDDWTHEYLVRNGLVDQMVAVRTVPDALRVLASGIGDVAFLPHLVGLLVAKDEGLETVRTVGDPVPVGRGFGFAVREGDEALLQRLNEGLAIVKATGRYDQIFEKWFGVVDARHMVYWTTQRLMSLVIIPGGLILVLLVTWRFHSVVTLNAKLEGRVLKRTAELQAEKQRAETYLDVAGTIMVALDPDGTIEMINRRGAQLLGWEEKALTGMNWCDRFVFDDHRDQVRRQVARIFSGERTILDGIEYFIITRDGERRLTRWNMTALHDPSRGVVTGCLSAGEDITERRAGEGELLATKSRLEDVLESMTDGVVLYDKYQRYLLSNRTYRQIDPRLDDILRPGVPTATIVRHMIRHRLWLVGDEDEEKAVAKRVEQVKRANGLFEVNDQYGHTYLIKDQRTREGGTLVTRTDITDRKKAEQHLFHAQKMEALGALAGGVAHSLNNLLTPIMALTNIVKSELPPDGMARVSMEKISIATGKAKELVRGILAFSRQDIANMEKQDLHLVVQGAVELIREVIPKTISFSTRLDPDIGLAVTDRSQVESVILNIVTNAVAAIGDRAQGRIDVTLDRVSVSGQDDAPNGLKAGRYALLSVRDNGPGIDDETQARIFDPFFTTKGVDQGTGLGLSMALGVVEKHGGTIRVRSKIGDGARFDVFLPLEEMV